MGDLIWSIVPLVALVVWILANLFGAKEDQLQKPAGRRRQPQPQPRPRGPNRDKGLTELDRFLRELAKEEKRKAKEQETAKPPPLPKTRRTREAERAPSREPTPTVIPPAPRVRTPRVETPPREVPVLKVVEEEERVPKYAPLHDIASEASDAAEQKRVRQIERDRPSPAAERLVALLSDPESVQTAVLMHEVLGRPRAFSPYHRIV